MKRTISMFFILLFAVMLMGQAAMAQSEVTSVKDVPMLVELLKTVNDNSTSEEVKEFMRSVLKADLPVNLAVPSYITSSNDVNEVLATLDARYPDFTILERSEEGVSLIAKNAVRYVEMMMENKQIRKQFAYLMETK